MLRRILAYILVTAAIGVTGLIQGSEHVVHYQVKQHKVMESFE